MNPSELRTHAAADQHAARSLPTKLAQPRRRQTIFQRPRLVRAIDRAVAQHALVWVEGPPGAGKTLLVQGWLRDRKRPAVWYDVDAGDADPATFFHYLGLAVAGAPRARRQRGPSEAFAAADAAGAVLFARRWFEQAWRRLPRGSVLVFDDCHEVAAGAGLADFIAIAAKTAPQDSAVLACSRNGVPPALARAALHGEVAVLDGRDLRLTLEETGAFACQGRSGKRVATAQAKALHARSGGWFTGLALLLAARGEPAQGAAPRAALLDPAHPELLFAYLGREVFERLRPALRDALLRTAVLPRVSEAAALALTGNRDAWRELGRTAEHRHFVFPLRGAAPLLELHPLFREFLLARAREDLGAEAFLGLERAAAGVLLGEGDVDAAVPLLIRLGDPARAAEVIAASAEGLVMEGRHALLAGWLRVLPDGVRDASPDLVYWLGMAEIFSAPRTARGHFEQAHARFSAAGRNKEALRCIAGILNTYPLLRDEFVSADRWIAAVDGALRGDPGALDDPAIAWPLLPPLLAVLAWRDPRHPRAAWLIERGVAILRSSAPPAVQMQMAASLIQYCYWDGDHATARMVTELTEAQAERADGGPGAKILRSLLASLMWGMTGDTGRCRRAAEAGLALAKETGIALFDFQLQAQRAAAALLDADTAAADRLLDESAPLVRPGVLADTSLHAYLRGWRALIDGQHSRALAWFQHAIADTRSAGIPAPLAASLVGAGRALGSLRREAEARAMLGEARELARRIGSPLLQYAADLASAVQALTEGDKPAGDGFVRSALACGRRQDYRVCPGHVAQDVALLCERALEAAIEPERAKELVRGLHLTPRDPAVPPADWPYPVEIRALGSLEVRREGRRLGFGRKSQKKVLALLSLLLASQGPGVPLNRLAETLWPHSEGDIAHRNLKATLHRLRQWLGEDVLRLSASRLSVDLTRCRVDAFEFETLAQRCAVPAGEAEDSAALTRSALRVVDLYRGPLLEGDDHPVVLAARERLRARLAAALAGVAGSLRRHAAHEQALELSLRAIDAEPLIEEFYCSALEACVALRRPVQGLVLWKRCQDIHRAGLGIEPSAQAQALAAQLQAM